MKRTILFIAMSLALCGCVDHTEDLKVLKAYTYNGLLSFREDVRVVVIDRHQYVIVNGRGVTHLESCPCRVTGRRTSGSFLVKDFDGKVINAGVSWKRLALVSRTGTLLTERRMCDSSQR